MQTIIFDSSCAGWSPNRERNIWFLEMMKNYHTDKSTHLGYLYLNHVYETLGAAWDPKWDNLCFLDGRVNIDIQPFEHENKFIIKVF